MLGVFHNTSLLNSVERTLNNFLDDGTALYAKNPDGTLMELQPGVQIVSMKIMVEVEDDIR